ncbi:MAG: DUF4870 domain-containing protein [bacterium]
MNNSPSKEERQWAMFCHLAGLAGFVIPFGNIIGPLVLWMLKKDESSYIDFHGKEAVNFQISITIYIVISIVLIILLVGILFLIIIGILSIVFLVVAAIKANDGIYFQYPLAIRFLK